MPASLRKTIAALEIIGGVCGLPSVVFSLTRRAVRLGDLALAMVLVAVYLFAIFAGVMLWRDTRAGRVASVVAQLIQLPKVVIPGVAFMVSYGLDFSVLIVTSAGPTEYGISLDLRVGAYPLFLVNATGLPIVFGVSMVSCLALAALLVSALTGWANAAPTHVAPPPAEPAPQEVESAEAKADFLRKWQALEKARAGSGFTAIWPLKVLNYVPFARGFVATFTLPCPQRLAWILSAAKDTPMMERFTDNAHAAVRAGFRGQPTATERALLAALAERGRGVAVRLVHDLGITADTLPANTAVIECRALVSQAEDVARRCCVNYVGTEHLLLALASLPGSALAACGASADRLGEALSTAGAERRRAHRPLARRIGEWCRLVFLQWR